MYFFVIAAAIIAIVHFSAALSRPRLSVVVAGAMWAAYAVYEYYVASGVLCDDKCNIRVDLVVFFPVLAITTAYGWRSYHNLISPNAIAGFMLGISGLLLCAGVSVLLGHMFVAGIFAMAAAAVAVYAVWSRRRSDPLRS